MVSLLALRAIDRGLEPQLGQIKDYRIIICGFSANYAALRSKNMCLLAGNQDNVSDCSDISTSELFVSVK